MIEARDPAMACRTAGHARGCPCRAGGDPIRKLRPPVWIAESDGIGHARSHRTAPRTACGEPAIDERYGWPVITKCRLCVVVLERAGA